MNEEKEKKWYEPVLVWLPNIYYVATVLSLLFIVAQVFFAKSSIVENSEWEKAKMTVQNIDRFKEGLKSSPLTDDIVWKADMNMPDLSTEKGWAMYDTTLGPIFYSVFEHKVDDAVNFDTVALRIEVVRLIEVLDDFAYPIIMGYANEAGSYRSVARQYHMYGNFILPHVFRSYTNIGLHAQLLYKLWRIRFELVFTERMIKGSYFATFDDQKDRLLFYGGEEITEAYVKAYYKRLKREFKKAQKEIEVFRKESMN